MMLVTIEEARELQRWRGRARTYDTNEFVESILNGNTYFGFSELTVSLVRRRLQTLDDTFDELLETWRHPAFEEVQQRLLEGNGVHLGTSLLVDCELSGLIIPNLYAQNLISVKSDLRGIDIKGGDIKFARIIGGDLSYANLGKTQAQWMQIGGDRALHLNYSPQNYEDSFPNLFKTSFEGADISHAAIAGYQLGEKSFVGATRSPEVPDDSPRGRPTRTYYVYRKEHYGLTVNGISRLTLQSD